jgi:hypothetical protein
VAVVVAENGVSWNVSAPRSVKKSDVPRIDNWRIDPGNSDNPGNEANLLSSTHG